MRHKVKDNAMKTMMAIPLLLGTLALAGCGHSTGDRAPVRQVGASPRTPPGPERAFARRSEPLDLILLK